MFWSFFFYVHYHRQREWVKADERSTEDVHVGGVFECVPMSVNRFTEIARWQNPVGFPRIVSSWVNFLVSSQNLSHRRCRFRDIRSVFNSEVFALRTTYQKHLSVWSKSFWRRGVRSPMHLVWAIDTASISMRATWRNFPDGLCLQV